MDHQEADQGNVGDQNVRVEAPHVRDRVTNSEALPTYRAPRQPNDAGQTLLQAILGGLSAHKHTHRVHLVPDAFGPSASSFAAAGGPRAGTTT
jgi:hypothetical protein